MFNQLDSKLSTKFRVSYKTFYTICVSSEKFMREDQAQIKRILFSSKCSSFTLFKSEPLVLNSSVSIEKGIFTSVPFT